MIVMKFGGTSVGTPERITTVASITKDLLKEKPVLVVSAVGGVTDLLIKAGNDALVGIIDIAEIQKRHQRIMDAFNLPKDLISEEMTALSKLLEGISILKEISPRSSDLLVSFGERCSAKMVASYLCSQGIDAKHYFSYDIGLITDGQFQGAIPLQESYANIKKSLSKVKHVPVVTGFLGKTATGDITTLGRGGSDYSAAIVGAAIEAQEIQIWTDVDGMMTTDPRIVSNAKSVPKVSLQEASELAYFGAKVLHPKTLLPAMEKNIPVSIKNTFNPQHPGTIIVNTVAKPEKSLRAIAVKKGVSLINIYSLRMLDAHGFLARIFEIFARNKIVVDMVSTSEVSVSVTINTGQDLTQAIKELSMFSTVSVAEKKAIICVVGSGLKHDPLIAGKVFAVTSEEGISVHMISQGASEINLSFVIDDVHANDVVKKLHQLFFEA